MITLRDKDTGRTLGKIAESDLQFLIDQLEEESSSDTDYWVDDLTIEMLEEDGAPKSLVDLLRSALADREGFDVQWSRA